MRAGLAFPEAKGRRAEPQRLSALPGSHTEYRWSLLACYTEAETAHRDTRYLEGEA
jgi:hypothetical protein